MGKGKGHRDSIGDYVEWTEHRYDPGHFLGGNLPPYLRKSSLSPRGRRRMTWVMVVSAVTTAASVVVWSAFGGGPGWVEVPFLVLMAAVTVLYILAAISMGERTGKRRGSKARRK